MILVALTAFLTTNLNLNGERTRWRLREGQEVERQRYPAGVNANAQPLPRVASERRGQRPGVQSSTLVFSSLASSKAR